MSYSSEYNTWNAVKARCFNPKNAAYKFYGGKGISMDSKWINSFNAFLKDMGRKPSLLHTIERKRNNLGYSKQNCYWATKREQSRNRGCTVWVKYNGRKVTQHDFAQILGVDDAAIKHHLKNKSTPEEIVNHYAEKNATPNEEWISINIKPEKSGNYFVNGVNRTVKRIWKEYFNGVEFTNLNRKTITHWQPINIVALKEGYRAAISSTPQNK